ncbi:C-type lectin domain family 4 member E-like [Pempheris klunzingeri]|uniref:C-type lectin domain family 4 member E-like n=1 Tax=Pempheris klunzingeri TaxID=3127111 RepID=UPI0039816C6B
MEEIYISADDDRPVDQRPAVNHTGPRSSNRRFHGAAVLCLGLLSVSLLAALVGLTDLQATDAKLLSLFEERDLLRATLAEMTEQLESLTKQKDICPEGWMMFGRSCYLLSTTADSWDKARQDCRDRGADLMVVDGHTEQEFLTYFNKEIWIGLNDRDNEGTWKWTDGSALTQAYWSPGGPDNGAGNPEWGEEDCVHLMVNRQTEKNWNDRRCDASLQWMCEEMTRK